MSSSFMKYLSESNPKMAEKLAAGFEDNLKSNIDNKKSTKEENVSSLMGEAFLKEANNKQTKEPSLSDINFLQGDSFIRNDMVKVAGLLIHDCTPEAIEQVLKNYVYNELSFFPEKLDVAVQIIPLSEAAPKTKGAYDVEIKDATGTVDIVYNGKLIQLPFIIQDKEMLPFNTIQVGSESAVYTRDNIRNILINLKNLFDQQNGIAGNPINSLSSFVGVDKRVNTLTDPGFMENMLRIQDSLDTMDRRGVSTYASKIEDLLEKTASIRKNTDNFDFVEQQAMYKLPKTEEVEKKAFVDALPIENLADIHILKNGAKFKFIEKEGDVIAHNLAAVFNGLLNVANVKLGDRIVVTSDARFRILKQGEKFSFILPKPVDDLAPEFNFKYRNIESLNPGGLFLGMLDGFCFLPFTVTNIVNGADKGCNISKIYTCFDLDGKEFNVIPDPGLAKNQIVIMDKNKALGRLLSGEESHKVADYSLILHRRRPIVFISSDVRFIQLNPDVINNINNATELAVMFDSNVKLAYMSDSLVIARVEGRNDRYNMGVNWFDSRSRGVRETALNDLDEVKVKGNLKNMGYNYDKIREIMDRVNSEGHATYSLTSEITPWTLKERSNLFSTVSNAISNIKSNLFAKDNASRITGTALSNVAATAISYGDTATRLVNMAGDLKAYASESEALANKLEKIAIIKESDSFNKLASMMVIKNRIDNMLIGALNDEVWEGSECLAELKELQPEMEKMAYDLVELSLAQSINKQELISPNVINGSLRNLDMLYKYSKNF